MSKNENYDISLSNNPSLTKETELIEIHTKNLKKGKGKSGYSQLINESEISTSSELLEKEKEKNDNLYNNITHEIFFQEEINYRKGNLFTYLYDNNGVPKIVIGPDCKYIKYFICI